MNATLKIAQRNGANLATEKQYSFQKKQLRSYSISPLVCFQNRVNVPFKMSKSTILTIDSVMFSMVTSIIARVCITSFTSEPICCTSSICERSVYCHRYLLRRIYHELPNNNLFQSFLVYVHSNLSSTQTYTPSRTSHAKSLQFSGCATSGSHEYDLFFQFLSVTPVKGQVATST